VSTAYVETTYINICYRESSFYTPQHSIRTAVGASNFLSQHVGHIRQDCLCAMALHTNRCRRCYSGRSNVHSLHNPHIPSSQEPNMVLYSLRRRRFGKLNPSAPKQTHADNSHSVKALDTPLVLLRTTIPSRRHPTSSNPRLSCLLRFFSLPPST
jgi:hypothetical protein